MNNVKTVFFGVMSADLFLGWEDIEQYNEGESAVQYAELVKKAIGEYYPEADISYDIQSGISGSLPSSLWTRINDDDQHNFIPPTGVISLQRLTDIDVINHLEGLVYSGFDWIVMGDDNEN